MFERGLCYFKQLSLVGEPEVKLLMKKMTKKKLVEKLKKIEAKRICSLSKTEGLVGFNYQPAK